MEFYTRWDEIKPILDEELQPGADLTAKDVLRRLASPRRNNKASIVKALPAPGSASAEQDVPAPADHDDQAPGEDSEPSCQIVLVRNRPQPARSSSQNGSAEAENCVVPPTTLPTVASAEDVTMNVTSGT